MLVNAIPPAPQRDRSTNVVTAAEIQQERFRNALEFVQSMRPQWLGKVTTAAQFVTLLVLVGRGSASPWLLGLTVLLSAAAAVDYALAFAKSKAESG